MAPRKGQDPYIRIIELLTCDVQNAHSEVFTPRSLRNTLRKLRYRYDREGIGFLTKTLPRLGKALDRALTGEVSLNCTDLRLTTQKGSKLPNLFGELFQRILSHDGWILPTPCVKSIKAVRQLLFIFYKLELPYSPSQEQNIISQFIQTEYEISSIDSTLTAYAEELDARETHSVPPGLPAMACLGNSSILGNGGRGTVELYSDALDARGRPCCESTRSPTAVQVEDTEQTSDLLASNGSGKDQVSKRLDPILPERGEVSPTPKGTGDSVSTMPLEYKQLDGRRRDVIRKAQILLQDLFAYFDGMDIRPRHGPGAVSTMEQLWEKYRFRSIPDRLTRIYPIDSYFRATYGEICSTYRLHGLDQDSCESGPFHDIDTIDHPARVCLVPKDSRGPRLISCESLANQWIQQGLARAIVELVESHPLTRWNVYFTDQSPNKRGALLGSSNGKYATLDLKEASDRVTVGLVRLLFPRHVLTYLLAARSEATTLPGGKIFKLQKYAPMGSALCFPVMALSIWSLLTAGLSDAKCWSPRRRIGEWNWIKPAARTLRDELALLVYGDDVIVPTAQAANAIELLESFGLRVNRDKSCTSGFFRESCGTDAYLGVEVQPVRIRTPWHRSRRPDVYASWISYANSLYKQGFYQAYDYIVELLGQTYAEIPERRPFEDLVLKDPLQEWVKQKQWITTDLALIEVPEVYRPKTHRTHPLEQRRQERIWEVKPRKVTHEKDGDISLFRFLVEQEVHPSHEIANDIPRRGGVGLIGAVLRVPLSVGVYTKRRALKLVRSWR